MWSISLSICPSSPPSSLCLSLLLFPFPLFLPGLPLHSLLLQNTIAFYLVSLLICSVFLNNTAGLGNRRRDLGLLEGMSSMHTTELLSCKSRLLVSAAFGILSHWTSPGAATTHFRSCCGLLIKVFIKTTSRGPRQDLGLYLTTGSIWSGAQ